MPRPVAVVLSSRKLAVHQGLILERASEPQQHSLHSENARHNLQLTILDVVKLTPSDQ